MLAINTIFPYRAAFPAESGTTGQGQPVIFTDSSNNKNISLMQTNFIEQLSATAPAGLEQATAALCGEVRGLLKARTPKRYLALEPYARDTNLCHHILDLLTGKPALPDVSAPGCRPLLMLLALSEDTEVQNRLLHGLVEPWRKACRTPEMLYLCDVLYQTRIPRPLYNMCNEVCDYFFVERRKQVSHQPTPLTEAELQYAEKRLKPLYAAVFRLKVNRYSYRTNSVEELAGMLCMSASTFREKFSKIYRQSANKWLREQRIGQIRRDLKYHYDRPLREIAEKNGFESANRFWEFCTGQMKQSPSELHKELYDELCEERRKFYLGE